MTEWSVPQAANRRIEIAEISEDDLANFLKSKEINVEYPTARPFYVDIFKALRHLPITRQEELLVEFFTQRVENFPNSEKLAKFLVKINNVATWLEPKEEPDEKTLQGLLDNFYKRLHLTPLPLMILSKDFETAKLLSRDGSEAIKRIWTEVWGTEERPVYGTGSAQNIASSMASAAIFRETLERKEWLPIYEASLAARWIVSEERLLERGYKDGNPFEILFDGVYDKGYSFLGPVGGKSVIFIPQAA